MFLDSASQLFFFQALSRGVKNETRKHVLKNAKNFANDCEILKLETPKFQGALQNFCCREICNQIFAVRHEILGCF